MRALDVNLYTGYIERRNIPKTEDIVSDVLTLYSEPADISIKIRDALYHAFSTLFDVDVVRHDRSVTNEEYDYEIRINEIDTVKVNFNTYGKYY